MLFRSPAETYNPQIHTEELSLTTQMNKDFAVHNKVISRFERYNKFTSWLLHTGRFDGGARQGWIKRAGKEINDNAYRVQYKSINIKPAYSFEAVQVGSWFDTTNPNPDMTLVNGVTYTNGLTSSTVVTDTLVSVAIKHDPDNDIFGDKFNETDSIVLKGGLGTLLWIQRVRKASTGDHFILDCKTIGAATEWDEDSFDEDEVFMEGGNYFGEGSLEGNQRYHQNYWKIFYSFTSRYSLKFTGHSLRQRKVIWTSDKNIASATKSTGYWQYEEEWFGDEMFGLFLELACRFASNSMDPSSHSWFENWGRNLLTAGNMSPKAGLTPPRTGNGWIKTIKDTIDLSYNVNSGFSAYLLEGVGNLLSNNSPAGVENNTFSVIGDSIGATAWDRVMKQTLGWNIANGAAISTTHNTNIAYNISTNQDVKLGFNVKAYHYQNNEYCWMTDELFSHPGLNKRRGGLVGTGNMYVLNTTPFDGVSNFELFSGGRGRFFKKKYVDGMHSLDASRDGSMFASSGFDGAFSNYLAELMPVVYVEDTCAVIRGDGDYAGGALSSIASAQLDGKFPTIM